MILIVDDDLDNLRLMKMTLEFEGYQTRQATSGEEALAVLAVLKPDMVLLDVNMPGISGLEVLEKIRQSLHYISVIMVSARSEKKDVITGLDGGADDYICKPFDPLEMLARVRAQLRIKTLHDRLNDVNEKLQQLVDIDDLTELFNMRSIYQKIEGEIGRSRRHNRHIGVVMMDMDDFKRVNDGNDHLFGSYVLSDVGRIIRETMRQGDFAARYGGDEFLIVLTDTNIEGTTRFSERLRSRIGNQVFQNKNQSIRLTASMGFALLDPSLMEIDARSLVRCADNALYESKRTGKNCVRSYDMGAFQKSKAAG